MPRPRTGAEPDDNDDHSSAIRKKSATITSTLYEARAGTALDCDKVAKLRKSLEALESTSKCGFMQLLSNGEGHRLVKIKFGEVPFGSCLSYQQLEEGAQLQSLPVAAVGGGLGRGDRENMVYSTCHQQPPKQYLLTC